MTMKWVFLLFISVAANAWDKEIKVPVRDGINLAAKIQFSTKGKTQESPSSSVLSLTPYSCDPLVGRAQYFSNVGFHFICVETRGRGNSDGAFEPFKYDAKDGYDAIEYLATQSFSNGNFGMWGGSYLGGSQWLVAGENPPHLKTIVPASAVLAGVDFPNERNIFRPYMLQWLDFVSGKLPSGRFRDTAFWNSLFEDWFTKGLAFLDLEKLLGNYTTVFSDWAKHPIEDLYWAARQPNWQVTQKLNIPVLSIVGYYDGDQLGGITSHLRSGFLSANQHILLGPWDHPGTRSPKQVLGGYDMGAESVLDMNELHRQWYDWTLNGAPKPTFWQKKVKYYTMGEAPPDRKWRDSDSLVGALIQTVKLKDLGFSPKSARIENDPNDLSSLSWEKSVNTDWLIDTSYLQRKRSQFVVDMLVNSSKRILGYVTARLHLAVDAEDADIGFDVYDIDEKGNSLYLTGDLLRLRYASRSQEKMITPNKEFWVNMNQAWLVSSKVEKNHKLRFVFYSLNSMYFSKNHNVSGNLVELTNQSSKKAIIRVFNDSELSIPWE